MYWVMQILWLLVAAFSIVFLVSGPQDADPDSWIKISTIGDAVVSFWIVGALLFYAWHRFFDYFLSTISIVEYVQFYSMGTEEF